MSTPPRHESPVTLIGIPLDLGAENLGVDIGPDAFRYSGLISKLEAAGLTIHDHGNVTVPRHGTIPVGDPKARHLKEIVQVSAEVAQLTQAAVKQGHRVVGLGGDHSVTLGLVSGAAAAVPGDLGLIYFDAHGDMNTPDTTLTGNIHGMHLAALLGFGHEDMTTLHGPSPKIKPQNLLHIGGSDFDQAELDLVAREHLPAFFMQDLLVSNLAPLFALIDRLATQVEHIWVSVDLDVIDRLYAPGAGMPNQGGLNYREIAAITQYIGSHANVIGLDIVEYNPLQDEQHKTAELATELIAKLLGHDYNWYTSYYLTKNNLSR